MEPSGSSLPATVVSPSLAVDTRAAATDAPSHAPLTSPPVDDARIATSPTPELVRKDSNEWASPRRAGRRGTPPPMPRRVSRGGGDDDDATTAATPERPRTPAQVLASRAASARATSTPVVGASPAHVTEPLEEKAAVPEGHTEADGGGDKEDDATLVMVGDEPDEDARRSSMQLEHGYPSDEEDGDLYHRDERLDTSTVDEESMYNEDEEVEEEEDDVEASAGTSDEYVNIHGEQDLEEEDEEEDEVEEDQQRQFYGGEGDDSLTPDNTPPPSPPRVVRPRYQRSAPPQTSEWVKYVAESGHEYYFNTRTNESQWTQPAALLSQQQGETTVDEEEEGPEENQSTHGESMGTSPLQMVPQLYVQVAGTPPHEAPSYLEHLFAAAAKSDETAQLQAMLRYEVDVNAVNASGLAPLHVAVQHGNARGAAMLLDYGAHVDGPSEDTGVLGTYAPARLIETPLVMACRTNHASLVRLLVRYGASIYTRDNDGNTVLHIAIRCWSDDVLSCLLEMDSVAAILNLRNAEDETPLHLAARHGNANAVKALLSSGASTDVEDAQGRTPLVVSIMENRVDCAQLLQGVLDQKEGFDDTSIANVDSEPAMYDSTTNENDNSTQTKEELEGLRMYLIQLAQHVTADGVLVSTIYQYMDAVQREIGSLTATNAESRQREEHLLSEIDNLTNHESIVTSELAKEREETERLRQQLEAKEVEFNSLQAAYESLSSRSTMLESIARSSQDKLRRERAEFARQEEYWNQTIDNSLRENAALLESVQSLQQAWPNHPAQGATAINDEEPSAGQKVHEDSYDTTPQQQDAYNEYGTQANYQSYDTYYRSGAYSGSYDASYLNYNDSQLAYADQVVPDTKATPSPPSAKSEPERPISPERVDAVWNRFFENMSRAADTREQPAYSASQNSMLPPRQGVAPVSSLPPASAVFDAVRKNSSDRLHQLLLSGISPNVRDLGEKGTPLHLASELGDLDSVMLLCEFGADVEIRDENGNTPLLVACSQGHYECTKFLLQSAANQEAFNSNRDTALHLAAWDGSVECVEILLEYGVDVLARNALGLTALVNLKTRSPLRHRFDDLAGDHPMAKTLLILDEAERLEQEEEAATAQVAAMKAPTAGPTPLATNQSEPKPQAAASPSWGRWILGSVFGSTKAPPADEVADTSDDDKSDFHEAASSPSKLYAAALHDFEDLRPPPEIEAELRRKPLSPSSAPLPPPPPEVLDALEKRKLGHGGGPNILLSPTTSATRFASPASMAPTKKSMPTTPTSVRSRYVDTFNNP